MFAPEDGSARSIADLRRMAAEDIAVRAKNWAEWRSRYMERRFGLMLAGESIRSVVIY